MVRCRNVKEPSKNPMLDALVHLSQRQDTPIPILLLYPGR